MHGRSFFQNIFFSKQSAKSTVGLKGFEYVDAIFHNLIAEKKVPGIATTILRQGQVLFQKGYGYADVENEVPVNPTESIFRIASISKCITGLALGKMVEEGILDWDDSFYRHVPYYPKKEYDFTLRQLASHTAGIRGYKGKEFALNQPYSIKESIEVFKNDPLVFEPGKGYLYNSFDFVLLSLAMQEASGISFEDYVQENLLNPLGMIHTFPPNQVSTALDLRFSEFYTKNRRGFKKAIEVNNFYKLAGGGYLSTSQDIATLGQAMLEQQLLKKDTFNQLLRAQTIKGKSTYYGLGFQVSQDVQGKSFIGHVGNSVGAYTNFFVYPKESIVICILTNCTNPNVQGDFDASIRAIMANNTVI